ncbi:MAG TPA: hypothetical protein VK892_15530 [Pyrinomonadaceae bacterium]|nr:hypothetical protein [Pyrinomonadaceae bacterium]
MAENIVTGMNIAETEKKVDEMSEAEILRRIVELGFDGDWQLYQQFCEKLRSGLPEGTGVALRGSVVTNERYEDGEPFDAKGDRTSDLDVALIGDEARKMWDDAEYYIPLLHTKPLGDETAHIAPALEPLRRELQEMVGRPVHFQATADFIMFVRDVLMSQPYFMIIEPEETV